MANVRSRAENGSSSVRMLPPSQFRSEIKVQSELDDAVRIRRCAADCAESNSLLRGGCRKIADGWVAYRFGKLWVIRQVENSSLKSQLGLVASRDLEVFLNVEVEIVSTRVANV